MSRVSCNGCGRSFLGEARLRIHINAPRNPNCRLAYARPTDTSPSSGLKNTTEGTRRANQQYRAMCSQEFGGRDVANVGEDEATDGALMVGVNQLNASNGQSAEKNTECVIGPEDNIEPKISNYAESSDDDTPLWDVGEQRFPDDYLRTVSDDKDIQDFREYTKYARHNYLNLPADFEAGVKLMRLLADRGCPLGLYNLIYMYAWHMEYRKPMEMVSRKRLMKVVKDRLSCRKDTEPMHKKCYLPHSKANAKLVCHDAKAQLRAILTDPRWNDDDFLFFGDSPDSPPPEKVHFINDISTSRAYRESYNQLIAPNPIADNGRKKVSMPVFFYMDGCVMGQHDNLPLEALKVTVGVLKGKARDLDHAWKPLGYVTRFLKEKNEAQDIIAESQHNDAQDCVSDDDDESIASAKYYGEDQENFRHQAYDDEIDSAEEVRGDPNEIDPTAHLNEIAETEVPETKAQDLHSMLHCMLESYVEMQDSGGLTFDMFHKGKLHKLQFIPYCHCIKGDTVEHDKHCGSYNSRTSGVKQLCRACCCPTDQTDEPHRDFACKSKTMIEPLITANDEQGLKNLSQQLINNAWYRVRFGSHNDCGVHGACPLELLHWLLLGQCKYLRGMFYYQTGKESKLSEKINAIAQHVGYLFSRQSDRDKPRTKFSKGMKKGKLQGHEMTGLMLVLLATLRCARGRKTLIFECRGEQKKYFACAKRVTDWVMLLETMLGMEAWLEQCELRIDTVKRFRLKAKEIMAMMKLIGKRVEGMGFKTFNFHGFQHVSDEILDFGVPCHVNTRSNESGHKRDKRCAKRTQRRPATFDMQTATQISDLDYLDLAMEDVNGRPLWDYYTGYAEDIEQEKVHNGPSLGGTSAECYYCSLKDKYIIEVKSRMKRKKHFQFKATVAKKLHLIHHRYSHVVNPLSIYTELKLEDDEMHRGSPYYNGKPWNDWSWFEMDNEVRPAQIQCYIDLRRLPAAEDPSMPPGIYALVEPASWISDPDEQHGSQFFVPHRKDRCQVPDDGEINTLRMLNVESMRGSTVLIPDLDHKDNSAYLQMVPMSEWADSFEDWINTPHEQLFRDSD